jgi:hypothetical protein
MVILEVPVDQVRFQADPVEGLVVGLCDNRAHFKGFVHLPVGIVGQVNIVIYLE